jgi:hypothetical protein
MKKFVVGGIVLVLITCGWGTLSVGEQMPAPRGELRVVDKVPPTGGSDMYLDPGTRLP